MRRAPSAAGWSGARRVLCVRLDNLGDVLMTTPALRALKAAMPGRQLTLWCSRAGAALAPHVPEIDDVLVYDAPWVSCPQDPGAAADLDMVHTLARGAFDAAVIFTVYTQSALPAALMCRLAGIPRVLAHSRENPYRLISERVEESDLGTAPRHEVQRQLDLVARIGAHVDEHRLSFRLTADAMQRATATLAAIGVDGDAPFVLLHPGASAESRRYPAPLFARAADLIRSRTGYPLVLVAGAAEGERVRDIQSRMQGPVHSLVGALDLGGLAATIRKAAVLVGNNSGPVHLAAAVGTPVVDLYALTNPQHAPWQVPHRLLTHDVPCRWCYRSRCPQGHHACMTGIRPEAVADAACELLSSVLQPQACGVEAAA